MKAFLILFLFVHIGFAQPVNVTDLITLDQDYSDNDVRAIKMEDIFNQIRSSLNEKRPLNDTARYTVRFELRRGMGVITEEMNYAPHQGEGYKATYGPPNAFQNDKRRQAYIERFEVAVLDYSGRLIWKGGYNREADILKPISEKEQIRILKRINQACLKFKF